MSFRITGLPLSDFSPLFVLTDAELARHDAIRKVADNDRGFPCRVSLQEARTGETVLLLNYEHLPVASPYRSRHAIFVREAATEARLAPGDVPELMRTRLLSVRAFDRHGMMCAAEVTPGTALENIIEPMFADAAVEYLHIHNANRGCYSARVERA